MTTNYNDIDFLLQTLFEYAYNNADKCVYVKYGPKKNIELDTLKKPQNFDYSQIFNAKITYHSNNQNKLVFTRISTSGYPSLLRISFYSKDEKISNISNKHVIDMKLNYILSEIAIDDPYKFLLFPIINFDVKLNDLDKELKNEIMKYHKKKDIGNDGTLCVQVFEHYHKLETLKEYLDKHHNDFSSVHWKVLAFKIIYILYKIQLIYPLFRHNQLDLEALYVYETQDSNDTHNILIDDYEFIVPNLGFNLKITNFYKSNIPVYADNIYTKYKKDNQYFDVHYIFSSLLNYMKDNSINDYNFNKFINEIIPQNFMSNNIKLDEEYYFQNIKTIINPFIIITKNIFFSEFIKDNMSRMNKKLKPSLEESTLGFTESSMTDSNSDGFGPSLLAKKLRTNKSNESVVGTRRLNNNVSNKTSVKYFNDFGELTETEPNRNRNSNSNSNKKHVRKDKQVDTNNFLNKLLFAKNKETLADTSIVHSFEGGLSDSDDDNKKEDDSSSTTSTEEENNDSSSSTSTEESPKKSEDTSDDTSSLPNIAPNKQPERNQPQNNKDNGLFSKIDNYARSATKSSQMQSQAQVFNTIQDDSLKQKSIKHKSRKHKSRKHKSKKHNKAQQNASNMPKVLETALPSNYNGPIPHELLSYLPQLNDQMMGPNMMGPNMMGPNMMGPNMDPGMMQPNMMQPNMMQQMGPNPMHPLAQMGQQPQNSQFDMGMGLGNQGPMNTNNQMDLDNAIMGNKSQTQFNSMMTNQQNFNQPMAQPMMDGQIDKNSHINLLPNTMLMNDSGMQTQNMQAQNMQAQMVNSPMMNQQMNQPQMNQQMNPALMNQQMVGGKKRSTKSKKNSKNDFFFLREEHQK